MIAMPYQIKIEDDAPTGYKVRLDGDWKSIAMRLDECDSVPLHHDDVVVDIGAHVGAYAVRCAQYPVTKVIAYEPDPRAFAVLSRFDLPNLHLVNAAVAGDDEATARLHLSPGLGLTSSIVIVDGQTGVVRVPAVRYEDAVAGATVVKIDAQGAEYDYPVVQPGVRALIIDFHAVPGRDWRAEAEGMVRRIESAGFHTAVDPFANSEWLAGSWIRDD